MIERKVLLIVGPTAVGKTALAIRLAKQLKGEIVSADSRQVYREMNIGTAKPSAKELSEVPHHFINIRDPKDYFSAGEYGKEARECINQLFQQDVQPIVVGGSGFYIKALVDGLFAPKVSDQSIKEKIQQRFIKEPDAVFTELQSIDPKTAARLHPNDVQRIVRALEVYELTGRPISDFQAGGDKKADFTPVFIGLTRERKELYQQIERRVDQMFEDGLVDEVKNLQARGYSPELNSLQSVGYQEIFAFFNGEQTLEQAKALIKQSSRRYAKRQFTWFRRDKRIHWLDVGSKTMDELVAEVMAIFTTS